MSGNSVIIVINATNQVIVLKNGSGCEFGKNGKLQLEMQNSKNLESHVQSITAKKIKFKFLISRI
jgi:hypothetical protein